VGSWQFGPFRLVHLNARNLLQDELTVSNIRDAEATASTPEPEGGARCVSSEWDSPFDLNLIKPPRIQNRLLSPLAGTPMSDHLQRNQLTTRVVAFIVMTIIVCGGVFVLIHYWLT
jgi:hypothetical protein